jgi:predicted Zn-dependent peptidase
MSYSVGSFFTPQICDGSSVFGIYASFAPEQFARFRSAVHALIKSPPVDTVSESDIRQAVDSIRRDRRASLANDLVLAMTLASNLVTGQTMLDAERADDRLAVISVAEVRAAMARLLAPEGLSIVFAGDLAR